MSPSRVGRQCPSLRTSAKATPKGPRRRAAALRAVSTVSSLSQTQKNYCSNLLQCGVGNCRGWHQFLTVTKPRTKRAWASRRAAPLGYSTWAWPKRGYSIQYSTPPNYWLWTGGVTFFFMQTHYRTTDLLCDWDFGILSFRHNRRMV